jgi:hypothetical protein
MQVLYFPSVYPRELVDAALGRQSGVNVALSYRPSCLICQPALAPQRK